MKIPVLPHTKPKYFQNNEDQRGICVNYKNYEMSM